MQDVRGLSPGALNRAQIWDPGPALESDLGGLATLVAGACIPRSETQARRKLKGKGVEAPDGTDCGSPSGVDLTPSKRASRVPDT